jgi:hypothetical protein
MIRSDFFIPGRMIVPGRHTHIHAVRPAAGVIVDPAQFGLQLAGGERGGAQHTKAAGLGYFRHHVPAMRECKDRDVAAQSLGDLSPQQNLLQARINLQPPVPSGA